MKMWWTKKNDNSVGAIFPVLEKIKNALRLRQRKWADWLQQRASGLSRVSLITLFVLFSLGFSGASGYVIYDAWCNKPRAYKMQQIHLPVVPKPVKAIPRWLRFKWYMDSLQRDASGNALYEHIIKGRSGLIDSLKYLEQIYQH